jgi:putative transposase
MTDICALLICLRPLIDTSTYRQLQNISQTMLMMTGRITMLGISRWAEKGCSYRTIQRFFAKNIPWGALNWAIIKPFLKQDDRDIIIAGDATTVTKSGWKTFGLGRFFLLSIHVQFQVLPFKPCH